MAKTCDLGSATAGVITLSGTVDGVDLAALAVVAVNHDHGLSGNVSTVASGSMALTGTGSETSFYTASNDSGTGAGFESASGSDSHTHAKGTLASDVETASTALSAKSDGEYTVDPATGDLVCDTIDGVAPEVLYDQFDGHWHTITGSTASTTLSAVSITGASGKTYFRVADDASGTNPVWATVSSNPGAHSHANDNLALSAYNAGSGAGSNDASDPKFAVDDATGNLSTRGDVNDIGIAQFKAKYDAHTHVITGATAQYVSGQAYCFSASGKEYFLTSGATWVRAYFQRSSHSHSGSGLTVATPS
jgi:hypothetical protein